MTEFVRVASLDEVPQGSMKGFEAGYDRVLIVHTEKGVFALADECTHQAVPLSDGKLTRGGQVVCTAHGARFNPETGAVEAPPAIVGVDRYETKVENGEIFVKFD